MNKRQKILWIIDALTIVFVIITFQSIAVRFEKFSDSRTLKENILLSIQLCSVNGWAGVLREYLGDTVVLWANFLLFIANSYAAIRKIIGMFKRDISPISRWLIVVNLLFITLRLIELDDILHAVMGG